jgi:hypothetical protein
MTCHETICKDEGWSGEEENVSVVRTSALVLPLASAIACASDIACNV